jgi:transposase-like protein
MPAIKKTKEDYEALAQKHGLIWNGKVPETTGYKCLWICQQYKHPWNTTYNNIRNGSHCPKCTQVQRSKNMQIIWGTQRFETTICKMCKREFLTHTTRSWARKTKRYYALICRPCWNDKYREANRLRSRKLREYAKLQQRLKQQPLVLINA